MSETLPGDDNTSTDNVSNLSIGSNGKALTKYTLSVTQ